jgi:hypothetical protein
MMETVRVIMRKRKKMMMVIIMTEIGKRRQKKTRKMTEIMTGRNKPLKIIMTETQNEMMMALKEMTGIRK